MIKTYLVPTTEEVVKEMEKGEAPSFLHCATCLDGLTNGEIMQKVFPYLKPTYIDEWEDYNNTHSLFAKAWVNVDFGDSKTLGFDLLWWNAKWG